MKPQKKFQYKLNMNIPTQNDTTALYPLSDDGIENTKKFTMPNENINLEDQQNMDNQNQLPF